MGLGLMLIQTVVNLRQGMKTKAAKLVWELFVLHNITMKCHLQQATLLALISQTQMLSISDAFQQHMWKHRQGRGEWSVIPAAHQCVLGKVPVCSTGSPRRFTSSSVPQTVFSPQDHADSGLPHGPEELPHGRTDVHHAVRKLWVLSTSPSLPSPSPAATHSQFSLHWRFAQEPLAQDFPFIQHMWHFLKKPNLKRSHMRCPGLLVFTLAFRFGGKRGKCFQLQTGFFLSGWTFAPCTCCLSQRRERWWATSFREWGQVGKNSKQLKKPNSRKNVICCRWFIAHHLSSSAGHYPGFYHMHKQFCLNPNAIHYSIVKESQDRSLPPSIALFYKSEPFQISA